MSAPQEITISRRLFVGGLPSKVTEEVLRETFARFGTIQSISIKGRRETFAFIEYEKEEDATKAIEELNGSTFQEQTIKVERANGGREKKSRLAGRTEWRLHIANLPTGTTTERVKELLGEKEVSYCDLVPEKEGTEAVVDLATEEEMKELLEKLQGSQVDEQTLTIEVDSEYKFGPSKEDIEKYKKNIEAREARRKERSEARENREPRQPKRRRLNSDHPSTRRGPGEGFPPRRRGPPRMDYPPYRGGYAGYPPEPRGYYDRPPYYPPSEYDRRPPVDYGRPEYDRGYDRREAHPAESRAGYSEYRSDERRAPRPDYERRGDDRTDYRPPVDFSHERSTYDRTYDRREYETADYNRQSDRPAYDRSTFDRPAYESSDFERRYEARDQDRPGFDHSYGRDAGVRRDLEVRSYDSRTLDQPRREYDEERYPRVDERRDYRVDDRSNDYYQGAANGHADSRGGEGRRRRRASPIKEEQ